MKKTKRIVKVRKGKKKNGDGVPPNVAIKKQPKDKKSIGYMDLNCIFLNSPKNRSTKNTTKGDTAKNKFHENSTKTSNYTNKHQDDDEEEEGQ